MSMRLLVAVPTTDYVNAGFLISLIGLSKELKGRKIDHDIEVLAGTLV